MIDVENVTQTGAGVYGRRAGHRACAELEGLFPAARIPAQLGKGFVQSRVRSRRTRTLAASASRPARCAKPSFIGSRGSEHRHARHQHHPRVLLSQQRRRREWLPAAADHGARHRAERHDHPGPGAGRLPDPAAAEVRRSRDLTTVATRGLRHRRDDRGRHRLRDGPRDRRLPADRDQHRASAASRSRPSNRPRSTARSPTA